MKNKVLLIIIVAGLISGGLVAAVLTRDKKEPNAKAKSGQSADGSVDASVTDGRVTEQQANGESQAKPSPSATRTLANVTVTSVDQSADSVNVRAIVSGATSGTCELVFSQAGQSNVEASASLAQAPTYYICQGFDVAKSNFPTKGEWQLQVRFSSDVAQAVSESKSLTIN